jgi:sarcosine oxidase, subunit gamma
MAETIMTARREGVLAGRSHTSSAVSLRAPASSVQALSVALGLDLPTRPKTSASADGRAALWLGPDEWLILGQDGDDLLQRLAGVEVLHSAVDVSHRNVGIEISGIKAEAVLSAACPQDLRQVSFPAGAASRTIFGKTEIVLLRTGPDAFRIEVCHSRPMCSTFSRMLRAARRADSSAQDAFFQARSATKADKAAPSIGRANA